MSRTATATPPRAAARAGCGQGEEAAKLDGRERARWRKQALKWLEADLLLWTKLLEGGTPPDHKTVAARLQHWQRNRDLAGIRDAALLAKLPPGEREACSRLWADVEAVLRKAVGQGLDGARTSVVSAPCRRSRVPAHAILERSPR